MTLNYDANDYAAMAHLQELEVLNRAADAQLQENKYLYYRPYRKQYQFHCATTRERMLIAGNQLGKTYSAGMEFSYHVTGQYPRWWKGWRITEDNDNWTAWVAGVSLEGLRDGAQNVLLGPVGKYGTGCIPKSRIIDVKHKQNDTLDYIIVRWGPENSNRQFFISFKSYDQGREKFQAAPVKLIWFDEEPDETIYFEGITRTNATKGKIMITFTPLKGITGVVKRYLYEPSPDRMVVNMTIDDAGHISPEERQTIVNGYPAHERDARTRGIPVLGSGLVYPVEDSLITVDPFPIPSYWQRIGAMDFGWDHPFAAGDIYYDFRKDTAYLTTTYRISHRTPADHVQVLRKWGDINFAWPRDGHQHDKGSGKKLADIYRTEGLQMLEEHAQFEDGTYNVEPGLFDLLLRMKDGRFKVFSTCTDFFHEKQLYHRKDGKIYKVGDDIMDLTRYGIMSLRHAQVPVPINAWLGHQSMDLGRRDKGDFALGTGEMEL